MRIAVVDDIAAERKTLLERLGRLFECRCVRVAFFEYGSGEEFLEAAKHQPFTVVFLDIYMHGITGIETARQLRSFDPACLLIFTTTSADHALEGFRVRAMHYLVKPYSEEEVASLIDEILQQLPAPDSYIEFKANGSDIRLPLGEILYAEHFSHQITVHTTGGKALTTRQTFGAFTAPLKEDDRFFVCSRGVVANLDHAADFDGTAFMMQDGRKIGVSRDLQKAARQAFMARMFKRGRA